MTNHYKETVFRMCKVTLLHRYRISKALSGLNIYRGQPEFLEFLTENGDCSQKEIAEHFGVSPASVATSAKRMCKAGFIERTEDKNDRRINRLRITEKGLEALRLGREECCKIDSMMFSGFSAEELGEFNRMIEKITNNLSCSDVSEKEVIAYIEREDNQRKGEDKNV